MMDGTTQGLLLREPEVDVAAMATIVQDLIAGGISQVRSARWLRARVRIAGLGPHECAALEALRTRLCEHGATLLGSFGIGLGGW